MFKEVKLFRIRFVLYDENLKCCTFASTNQEKVLTSCHGGEADSSRRSKFLKDSFRNYRNWWVFLYFAFVGDRFGKHGFFGIEK